MTAKVFFLRLPDNAPVKEQALAIGKLYDAAGAAAVVARKDFVAIKLHVGEKNNDTHVKPEIIRELVDKVRIAGGEPFLTETSTLYKGERENAVKHLMQAQRHGFGIDRIGAPFIMADGLTGNTEYEVTINGQLHEKVKVAREVMAADALIVVSHPTGHMEAGLGACIKNMGMGLASRMGKMRQHSSILPSVNSSRCKYCQKCGRWCPQDAIIEKNGKAFIVADKCIGCGECIAVCRYDAVKFDWGAESGVMQRSMAEHAYGVTKEKAGKCFFFNVLVGMTKDCDCFNVAQPKLIPDLGLLASNDPIAIDKATLDLTAKVHGKTLVQLSYKHHDGLTQLEHGAKIGMGSLDYELIEVK